MSTISTGNSFLDSLRLQSTSTTTTEEKSNGLTQEDFFSLLSQQLSMQDPFNPVDNDQMISQMASFSTVDGIAKLNDEIVNLNSVMTSSQALQASGLVGRKVLLPTDTAYVSSDTNGMQGVVSTSQSIPTITVHVQDQYGQVVRTMTVDGSASGNIDVDWDGLDDSGQPVVAGNYSFKATGLVDGASQSLAVSTYAHVSSVSLGTASTGAILNLKGGSAFLLSDVLAVTES
ncbi:flagellar hook assembly protein FlgD [Shewanella acanthi]|uniref:flagellar hook assembly protein FlgD n=1 Tax=Shewanella acanthi TaxID=2864212 RepID=UPI001C661307|nr:flagellar hook assembly protein FlgD [Shewanella acanthi]QYJ79873.1 flagellar hook assembly protein FlgD [Shewanella acanthi]